MGEGAAGPGQSGIPGAAGPPGLRDSPGLRDPRGCGIAGAAGPPGAVRPPRECRTPHHPSWEVLGGDVSWRRRLWVPHCTPALPAPTPQSPPSSQQTWPTHSSQGSGRKGDKPSPSSTPSTRAQQEQCLGSAPHSAPCATAPPPPTASTPCPGTSGFRDLLIFEGTLRAVPGTQTGLWGTAPRGPGVQGWGSGAPGWQYLWGGGWGAGKPSLRAAKPSIPGAKAQPGWGQCGEGQAGGRAPANGLFELHLPV